MSVRREIAIGLGAYASYLAVRAIVWNERGRERANHNARTVATIERRLHIDIERRVQAQALRWPRLIDTLNVSYAAGNVGLTVAWLIVLHRRSCHVYRSERSAAVVAFAGALPLFAMFPTAPPRTPTVSSTRWRPAGWRSTIRCSCVSTTRSRPYPATTSRSPSSPGWASHDTRVDRSGAPRGGRTRQSLPLS